MARLLRRGARLAFRYSNLQQLRLVGGSRNRRRQRPLWPHTFLAAAAVLFPGDDRSMTTGSIASRYALGEVIGYGGFSIVRLGRDKRTGQACAIKVIPKDKLTRESFEQEVEILRTVSQHANIANFREALESSTAWYVVLDHCDGGELFDRLAEDGPYFSERAVRSIVMDLVDAMRFVHAAGIVHGDIKPENILLQERQLDRAAHQPFKLIDFGTAFYAVDRSPRAQAQRQAGTLAYAPPEQLQGVDGDGDTAVGIRVGKPKDVWGLGVVLYIMLSGQHPFDPDGRADDREVERRIVNGEWNFNGEAWRQVSTSAKDLIRELLHPDPSKRPSLEAVAEHPWMAGLEASSDSDSILSDEPLRIPVENLQVHRRGRLRLRASVMAVLMGLDRDAAQDEVIDKLPCDEAAATAVVRTPYSTSSLAALERSAVYERIVEAFDKDHKGWVTVHDLMRVINKGLGEELTETDAEEMLGACTDLPGTGSRSQTSLRRDVSSHTTSRPPLYAGSSALLKDIMRLVMNQVPVMGFPQGQFITNAGEVESYFYLLLNGTVEELLPHSSLAIAHWGGVLGNDVNVEKSGDLTINTLGEGELFGQMELLHRDAAYTHEILPRSTSCRCASEKCNVLRFHARDLAMLTDVYAEVEARLQRHSRKWMNAVLLSYLHALEKVNSSEVPTSASVPASAMVGLRVQHLILNERDVVVSEGDEDDHFYVVLKGDLVVEQRGCKVEALSSGDFFPLATGGDTNLLPLSRTRGATIRCVTEVELLKVEGAEFRRFLQGDSSGAHLLGHFLADAVDDREVRRRARRVHGK